MSTEQKSTKIKDVRFFIKGKRDLTITRSQKKPTGEAINYPPVELKVGQVYAPNNEGEIEFLRKHPFYGRRIQETTSVEISEGALDKIPDGKGEGTKEDPTVFPGVTTYNQVIKTLKAKTDVEFEGKGNPSKNDVLKACQKHNIVFPDWDE